MIGTVRPAAQPADHVDAVDIGQAEIEHHQIGRVAGGRRAQRAGPVGRDVDVVPAGAQVDPQRAQDLWFVVHDQDAGHSCDPPDGVGRPAGNQHHGKPPAGGGLRGARAAHGLGETAGQRQPEPDPVVLSRSPSRWNGGKTAPTVRRDARPSVDHPQLDPIRVAARGDRVGDSFFVQRYGC